MGELQRLLDSLGDARGFLLGGGIAWILIEVRSLRARAQEYRQKNEADHARLFSAVSEVKIMVEILLGRSIRPDRDGGAG